MASCRVQCDESPLDISEWDVPQLQQVADSGGVLYWSFRGRWMLIPNRVLRNTLEEYGTWMAASNRPRFFSHVPRWVGLLWRQDARPAPTADAIQTLPELTQAPASA